MLRWRAKLSALIFLFVQPAFAANCGFLVIVTGKVEILRLQTASNGPVRYMIVAKNSMPIQCDDVVVTRESSSAKIHLENGRIAMGPQSRIEIASFTKVGSAPTVNLLELTYGKIRALIQKKPRPAQTPPQAIFRVHTYAATTGVRGTDFFVSHDPNTSISEQATLDGQIEVTNNLTSQTATVNPGHQVTVENEPGKANLPLQVVPISESVKNEMRITSAVAKDDKEFTTPKAISTLGPPEKWILQRESVPDKYKKIKDDF